MNGVDPLLPARKVKHALFVARKRSQRVCRTTRFRVISALGPVKVRVAPYTFREERYHRQFVCRKPPESGHTPQFPQRVFALWLGGNPLTPRRRENLELMRRRIGLPVELITEDNLDQWVLPGHPLHPAYDGLSLVHRSDYLRAYLMHHHGGGYCDIKAPAFSWARAYERMAREPGTWLTGYPEVDAGSATRLPGPLGHDVTWHYSELVGLGGFMMRSHTPLTAEWLREVERRLDYYASHVAESPGGIRGEAPGYPVSWTRLLGGVLHPLQLKHLPHVRQDPDLLLEFVNYQ